MKNVQGTMERKMMQEKRAKSSFKNPQILTTWSLRKDLKAKDEPQNTGGDSNFFLYWTSQGFFTTVTVEIRKRPGRFLQAALTVSVAVVSSSRWSPHEEKPDWSQMQGC